MLISKEILIRAWASFIPVIKESRWAQNTAPESTHEVSRGPDNQEHLFKGRRHLSTNAYSPSESEGLACQGVM